jgi:site-specific recombinase XerD
MGALHDRMKEDLILSGYSSSTTKIYLLYARQFAKHFMRSPSQMGEKEVRTFLLHQLQERGISHSTHRQSRSALQFLYRVTLHRPYEAAHIPAQRTNHPLPVVLSQDEVGLFLQSILSVTCRAVAMTIYASGLRISEACRLQIKDIDSQRMLIHIRNSKGKKDRYTMLSGRLLTFLRTYWKIERPPVYLFPGKTREGHLLPQTVRVVFQKARKESGLKKRVTPHILRHCFATHLLESGVDVTVIKALLGHKSIRTTEIYTHVSSDHLAGVKSPLDLLPGSATEFPV